MSVPQNVICLQHCLQINSSSYICCLCDNTSANIYKDKNSFLSHLTQHHRVCRLFETLLQCSSVQQLNNLSENAFERKNIPSDPLFLAGSWLAEKERSVTEPSTNLCVADNIGQQVSTITSVCNANEYPATQDLANHPHFSPSVKRSNVQPVWTNRVSMIQTSTDAVEETVKTEPETFLSSTHISNEKSGNQASYDPNSSYVEEQHFNRSYTVSGRDVHHQNPTSHGEGLHCCTECNRIFTQRSTLKHHMIVHSGSRPHRCTVCEKRFSQICNLKRHMMIHSKEKPHVCSICSKKFIRSDAMKRHIVNIHTGEKPYGCTTCGKSFAQIPKLKRHMVVHLREKSQHVNDLMLSNTSITAKRLMRNSYLVGQKSIHSTSLGNDRAFADIFELDSRMKSLPMQENDGSGVEMNMNISVLPSTSN